MGPTRAERRKAARAERTGARRDTSLWRGPLPFIVSAAVILLAVGWSVVASRTAPAAPVAAAGAGASVAASVTTIPADVFDRVGAGGIADPLCPTDLPTLRGASGRPLVLYVGADFCPFCASERWSLVAALSRFGTFRDLTMLTRSSSTDVFPETPSLSFRGASYASDVVELSYVETADRNGTPLATPDPVQDASMARSDPQRSIPFVSIADRYVQVGSGYPPDVLRGKTWQDVAAQMRDPVSPVAKAVIGNANYVTAAICRVTDAQPPDVCGSPAVRAVSPKE